VGLSDRLSVQRTKMANQRTFLAYLRTALFCFVAGLTIVRLQPGDQLLAVVSAFLVLGALFTMVFGMTTYRKVKASLPRKR